MKTIWKVVIIAFIVGLLLVLAGIFSGASLGGFYLDKAGVHINDNAEEVTKINETNIGEVADIDVVVNYSDVEFVAADAFGIDIRGYGAGWNWALENGVLRIRQDEQFRMNFMVINMDMRKSYVRILCPKDAELGSVSVKTDSGDIKIGGFGAKDVNIQNSFGNVELNAVTSGGNLLVEMDSGRFTAADINAGTFTYNNNFGEGALGAIRADTLTTDCDSGNITLRDCVVGELKMDMDFGKTTATGIYSSKTTIDANSGEVDIEGEFSGVTAIKSDFGAVKLTTSKPKDSYAYDIKTDFGSVTFDGDRRGNSTSSKSGDPSSPDILDINVSSGDVKVFFK